MRDIEKYEAEYLLPNFEDYQQKYRKKKILEIIQKYPHRKMLEIGVGDDPFFQYVDFETYTFFEPGDQFFQHAKEKISDCGLTDKVHGIHEPFHMIRGGGTDFILCASLLHEVEHPIELLQDIRESMTSSTVVHIDVPNANSFHRVLALKMNLIQDVHDFSNQNIRYQQNSVFDMGSLKQLAAEAGLKVIESGGYFIKPFTHAQMYQMMKSGIIDEKTLDGLYSMAPLMEEYSSEIYVNCVLA